MTRTARTLELLAITVLMIVVAIPFLWMLAIAFKPASEAFGFPPRFFPSRLTFENFQYALFQTDLARSFINSFIVAVMAMAGNVIVPVMAGYALAKLPFPHAKLAFRTVLATSMVPAAVRLIPLFLMVRGVPGAGGNDLFGAGGIGLLNTHIGLAVPHLVAPLNVFLARQFFQQLPDELAESGRIDGASEWRIFFSIYLPLARPLLATIAILAFTGSWDDFLWPLVVVTTSDMRTASLALQGFTSGGAIQWGPLMAASVLVMAPVVIIFLLNQRHFISGLSEGGVKG